MADRPILYSFRRCPYAMRARMALLISETAVALREVVLRDKPAALIAASPKATVPVLVTGGSVIDESLDIMRWALARHDPEHWLAGDDGSLIAANDGPFKQHLDRYKYPDRHGSDAEAERAAGLEMLHMLDARIAENGELCGPRRTLTDIVIFPFVRQFRATDSDWFDAQPLPALQAWLAGHAASSLFVAAMARFEPWREGDAESVLGATAA